MLEWKLEAGTFGLTHTSLVSLGGPQYRRRKTLIVLADRQAEEWRLGARCGESVCRRAGGWMGSQSATLQDANYIIPLAPFFYSRLADIVLFQRRCFEFLLQHEQRFVLGAMERTRSFF